jgi:hypothetical protein
MQADDIDGESRSEEDERGIDTRQMPSAGVMLGAGMAIIALGVLGWMIYRRRKQSRELVRNLAGRLPLDRVRLDRVRLDRIPGAFEDARDELMTQLRRVRSR